MVKRRAGGRARGHRTMPVNCSCVIPRAGRRTDIPLHLQARNGQVPSSQAGRDAPLGTTATNHLLACPRRAHPTTTARSIWRALDDGASRLARGAWAMPGNLSHRWEGTYWQLHGISPRLGWQLSHRQPAPRPPMEALRHCGALGLCWFSRSSDTAATSHHTPKGIPPARVKHGCRKGSHVPTEGVFSWARVRGMMTTQGQDRTGQCLGEGEGEWIGCPPEIQAPVRTYGMLQLAARRRAKGPGKAADNHTSDIVIPNPPRNRTAPLLPAAFCPNRETNDEKEGKEEERKTHTAPVRLSISRAPARRTAGCASSAARRCMAPPLPLRRRLCRPLRLQQQPKKNNPVRNPAGLLG
ncbi:hypothetical protein VFPFJ_01191 [Purpureocillium lilacinum]|uniref:Uncharacterized protein n=1 Tax=Purpureocillium lilacinum TaxID=33203 RepID=A0A179HYV4_PURLI|nr:hypothetical protein VFPFJ_01191 [Purpureocillium lilacinum]OAQ95082.1 hypothetical protein VFPFJ_01191 [Purpureocillium lilacinum]